jgi:hypothetical protein
LIVLAIIGAAFAWWVATLVEMLRIPAARWRDAERSKPLYVGLALVGGPLGIIVYYGFARAELKLSER